MREKIVLSVVTVLLLVGGASAADVVHDAEYYILNAQNGERWAAEDRELDKKLAELRAKYGQPPNIVYVLWDDTAFGSVGFPALQKNFGYETPNLNRMADEGINFTRMYTEPSCTPTRAAVLTGRHPVRHGMGVVGMPHEFSGLRAEEVTIAEVLSEAGYATAFCGKGHLGDIEESYLHNQGFDEALFTPMNQITSLYSPMGNAQTGFGARGLGAEHRREKGRARQRVVRHLERVLRKGGYRMRGAHHRFHTKERESRQSVPRPVLAQLSELPRAGDAQAERGRTQGRGCVPEVRRLHRQIDG
jgi:arylsulfatase A-like enzyme